MHVLGLRKIDRITAPVESNSTGTRVITKILEVDIYISRLFFPSFRIPCNKAEVLDMFRFEDSRVVMDLPPYHRFPLFEIFWWDFWDDNRVLIRRPELVRLPEPMNNQHPRNLSGKLKAAYLKVLSKLSEDDRAEYSSLLTKDRIDAAASQDEGVKERHTLRLKSFVEEHSIKQLHNDIAQLHAGFVQGSYAMQEIP